MAKSLRTFLGDCTRESALTLSGLWSFSYPDIITLPLTPDIITLLQHCSEWLLAMVDLALIHSSRWYRAALENTPTRCKECNHGDFVPNFSGTKDRGT